MKGSESADRLTIPDWSEQDRPREKFATNGASALSNAELLAILLRTGNATDNAVDLAKRLLNTCDNKLNNVSDLSLQQLTGIKGIGKAKAISILTAFEIGRRMQAENVGERQRVRDSSDIVKIMQTRNAHLKHEEFWVILLNAATHILNVCQIGKGGVTSTLVDVRIILQQAIMQDATAIILCHNHPSGSVKPSQTDIQLTRQIQQAANIFNIQLMDHVIIHKSRYFSFVENNLL